MGIQMIRRIVVNPVLNMETLQWEGNDGVYFYDGPVADFKGASGTEQANEKTAQNWANTNNANASQIQGEMLPFYQSEVTNPQGFGQQTLNEMGTSAGQATSGAVGGAIDAAKLNASRRGNTGNISSIIDATTRAGGKMNADSALDVALKNAQLKQAQQQSGIAGMGGLESQDVNASLSSLGLSNTAANDVAQQSQAAFSSIFGPLVGGAAGIAKGFTPH